MKTLTLTVEKILGNDIRTRARIFELTNLMEDAEECLLDFSGVTFISRSFADELISLSESSSRKINIINVNDEINTLLNIVRKGRTLKSQTSHKSNIHILKSMKDVENFFR